eukprot:1631877-Alexandrium_andersonii.AAC.1
MRTGERLAKHAPHAPRTRRQARQVAPLPDRVRRSLREVQVLRLLRDGVLADLVRPRLKVLPELDVPVGDGLALQEPLVELLL